MSNTNSNLLRNFVIFSLIGGVIYWLYKSGKLTRNKLDKLPLSEAKTKVIDELTKLSNMLGDGFKKKRFRSDTTKTKYSDAQLGDTLKMNAEYFHIFFYGWVSWPDFSETEDYLFRPFVIYSDSGTAKKSTGKIDRSLYHGTWKILGKKSSPKNLQMSFVKSSGDHLHGEWKKLKSELKDKSKVSTYSGSISEILKKATGTDTIILDALGKNKGK